MSKYYDPQQLFNSNMSRVAPTFAQTRYSPNSPYTAYNGPRDKRTGEPSYHPNMAAVEIYNAKDPSGMKSEKIFSGDTSNYGHSEPRMMRSGLDTLIRQNNPHPHDIQPPSNVYQSQRDKEQETLKNLVENPSPYKAYMESQGKKLNAISELPMCGSGTKGCSKFMQDISPLGSNLGHVVKSDWQDTRDYPEKIKEAMGLLGPSYQNYMNNRQSSQRPETPVFSPTTSQYIPHSVVNRYPSSSVNSPSAYTPTSSFSSMPNQISPEHAYPPRGNYHDPMFSPGRSSTVQNYSPSSPTRGATSSSSYSPYSFSEEDRYFPRVIDMLSPPGRGLFSSMGSPQNNSSNIPPKYLEGLKFSPGTTPKQMMIEGKLYDMPSGAELRSSSAKKRLNFN